MNGLTRTRRLRIDELVRAGRRSKAINLVQAAAEKTGCASEFHALWATLLTQAERRPEALAVIEAAAALPAGSADAYDALAYVALGLGQHALSLMLYGQAVEVGPNQARFWFNLASAERAVGATDRAEQACNRAISLDAGLFGAYLLRSDLRIQTPESNHVDELLAVIRSHQDQAGALVVLGHALAKEYDDLQRYDEAFVWLQTAAQARRAKLVYDVRTDVAKLERIAEVYRDLGEPTRPDSATRRFGFIVGLPRSGTTLVERILTGLPGVRSNGETDNFMRALLAATPAGSADIFSRAAQASSEKVAAMYERSAVALGDGSMVLDKLPLNYLYLGAIARALPDARLIALQRSPVDSCFAMYRTLFRDGYPFSYDFVDLARYYAAWTKLMAHWRRTLGSRLHIVRYEELVQTPEQVSAAMASYCGIQWRADALQITDNVNVSRTASASQVRRPIYSTSIGYRQRYKHHLEPLVRALRDNGVED